MEEKRDRKIEDDNKEKKEENWDKYELYVKKIW